MRLTRRRRQRGPRDFLDADTYAGSGAGQLPNVSRVHARAGGVTVVREQARHGRGPAGDPHRLQDLREPGGMALVASPRRDLRVFQRLDLPVFAETCLPLTMELAMVAREVIQPALEESPPEWAYEDRVLVMLAPSLREDVTRFYEGHGADLAGTFREHQIEHLDRDLVADLFKRIERVSPETAIAVVRGAGLGGESPA